MTITRPLWRASFTKETFPSWPCPTCGIGTLVLDTETFKSFKDAETMRFWNRRDFNPCDVSGTFSCHFKCNSPDCGETVGCCGSYGVDPVYDKDGGCDWVDFFRPLFFVPAVPVFRIPEACPDTVREQLKSAFALLWSDPWSAANRIRGSVEALLNYKRVQRTAKKKSGKRRRLSLDERIKLYGTKTSDSDVESLLMAVKWIGNAGSHSAPLSDDDLFDGFDMMEDVLHRLYDKSKVGLLRMSRKINKRRRPVRRKK